MSIDAQTVWLHSSRYMSQFTQRLQNDPRFNERLSFVASVILTVLIAWTLAGLGWQWFYTPKVESFAPSVSPTNQTHSGKATTLEGVSALHLFGEVDSKPVSVQAPVDAPDTRLQLVLSGVFAANDPKISLAIISQKGQKDKTYQIGDTLPGNVKLHQIYTDRVILSRSGKLETLRISKKKNNLIQKANVNRGARRSIPSTHRPPSNRINNAKKMFKSSPQELWKKIRITPVMKDGKLSGYHFNHNDRQLMKDLGLQPSDVITAINGQPVTDMNTMMATMNELDSMGELNLELMRNGVTQSISISLN